MEERRLNEPEKPSFDIIRASFYLVAFVFAVYAALIFVALGFCALNLDALLKAGIRACIKEGGLMEALSTLLASALAFAAGRSVPPRGGDK